MTEGSLASRWPGSGSYPVQIVGTHFYRENIHAIAQNAPGFNALVFCPAALILESNNPHDENAVLVEIQGRQVGHLPRELAKAFRTQLATHGVTSQATTCSAVITAGIDTPDRQYDYVIELDLDLTSKPEMTPSRPRTIERRDPCYLQDEGDGRFLVEVWLAKDVLPNLHKSRSIDSWTTEHWTTINYYAAHTKNCGIGHKLFSIPKDTHSELFGADPPAVRFVALEGRRAVVELKRGV